MIGKCFVVDYCGGDVVWCGKFKFCCIGLIRNDGGNVFWLIFGLIGVDNGFYIGIVFGNENDDVFYCGILLSVLEFFEKIGCDVCIVMLWVFL